MMVVVVMKVCFVGVLVFGDGGCGVVVASCEPC